ncbi:multivesicular body subunit 12A-like [Teleopsis dalmanni]|uniref:multivesicular body subunit 12A-like n=1 Tax=Teleopsis dalmanni TaxID=139649 RepID=UPI0018CCD257|nr:multivesicular body subunit 12A-like [Teleopsis dalmanni]
MNKAAKHIQSGAVGCSSSTSGILTSPTNISQKNVINSIMSFLPDNRPITSLQIVEDYEKCPKNFSSVHRTYDQDADADLWRENNILFGRQTTRYLCLSKTEGLPEYVVETLKVIAEKIQPPKEFSLLSRTADTEQKAWRKRQIAYKLSKRGTVTHAVTDIILCSKMKIAPDGFKLAGDINGVLVCFKTGTVPVRLPPPVPGLQSPQINGNCNSSNGSTEIEKALNRLNLNGGNNWNPQQPLPPVPKDTEHDYEEIQASYQINSPLRPAPRPPSTAVATNTSGHSVGTLGAYTELDGVPFIINPILKQTNQTLETLPQITDVLKGLDYDFQMERQILCTMKSSVSKNPFFK